MEFKELEIRSNLAEYCGIWAKEDIEDEIRECLGREPEGTEWIDFVLNFVIDLDDVNVNDVISNDAVEEIKIRLAGNDWIHIMKLR